MPPFIILAQKTTLPLDQFSGARSMEISKGEKVEWVVKNKETLVLKRKSQKG